MGEQKRKVMGWVRMAHIYLTLLALMLFIFFGATGFMLNHSDWFGIDDIRTESAEGELSPGVMVPLDRLAIVEILRTTYGASGAVEDFEIEEEEIRVIFKRPARWTEAVIARPSGRLTVTTETRGTAALLSQLHTGTDTGSSWWLLIDAASALLLAAALTCLTLWISLPRRRRVGLGALGTGVAMFILAYFILVP